MALFLRIFQDVILPVFVAIAVGVFLDRRFHVDKKTLATLSIYVLQPCLVFSSLSRLTAPARDVGAMILYMALITLFLILLAWGVGKLLRWNDRAIDALVLSVAFLNAGNMGLSIILFAFGEASLELGTVLFVTSNLTCHTLAPFFAARGQGGSLQAVLRVFRLPGPYAFAIALALRALSVTVPEVVLRPVGLLGEAAVPTMLLLLGVQLSQTRLVRRYKEVAVGVFLRLVVGSLAAFGLAAAMGLQGLARSVAVVEASTPTAVNATLMAVEFDADADYVTNVVFVTTLLSSLTLTLVIALVR
ncbi:MAG: AEC family transporter [Chloroflexi bacterium]|nr:AEC family transporter [Chloroflexota bacterium]